MQSIELNEKWLIRYENLQVGSEMASIVSRKETGWLFADLPCDVHMPLIEAK